MQTLSYDEFVRQEQSIKLIWCLDMSFFGDLKISPSLTAAVESFPHAVNFFFFEIRIKYLGIQTHFNLAFHKLYFISIILEHCISYQTQAKPYYSNSIYI